MPSGRRAGAWALTWRILPCPVAGRMLRSMAIDKETAERIEQPVSEEAEKEARLTPAEAVERMRINVPVRGNRKLRTLIERVNADTQLKGWWHVSNVNA